MRILAIMLVAAGSLGAMALGGRAIAADRMPRARHSASLDSALVARASAADRIWYGGTLRPIVVQAAAPPGTRAAKKADCP